ncbi:uncharacterized protein LOC143034971 [Oratosquilla oratoria]|uniref:uncharacterized protein LOC143034971 n=1 Tax=Oratosquilla oratoria TaxID=337810 RepID=UPI003F759EE3
MGSCVSSQVVADPRVVSSSPQDTSLSSRSQSEANASMMEVEDLLTGCYENDQTNLNNITNYTQTYMDDFLHNEDILFAHNCINLNSSVSDESHLNPSYKLSCGAHQHQIDHIGDSKITENDEFTFCKCMNENGKNKISYNPIFVAEQYKKPILHYQEHEHCSNVWHTEHNNWLHEPRRYLPISSCLCGHSAYAVRNHTDIMQLYDSHCLTTTCSLNGYTNLPSQENHKCLNDVKALYRNACSSSLEKSDDGDKGPAKSGHHSGTFLPFSTHPSISLGHNGLSLDFLGCQVTVGKSLGLRVFGKKLL